MKALALAWAVCLLSAPSPALAAKKKIKADPDHPIVAVSTSMGSFEIQLDRTKAPTTVTNFLSYVEAKHYDGTIFHRVIPGFMIQGGGFKSDMTEKPTRDPIKNESTLENALKNTDGSISMARTNEVDSATAQFFINVTDNTSLDAKEGRPGYAVFGKVIDDGMKVVRKIEKVKTTSRPPYDDVPETAVVIKSIRLKK